MEGCLGVLLLSHPQGQVVGHAEYLTAAASAAELQNKDNRNIIFRAFC
jgi:hypothetical protein